jgi:hypothetical protein
MNDSEFDAGLKQFTDPAGIYHEDFKSNFVRKPELREKLDALFRSRWPEEPPGPAPNPAPPQLGGTLAKGPGAGVDPGATVSEKSPADDAEIAEQHLRHQWGREFDANMKMMEVGRDSVFHKGDPADEIVYHAILGSPLASSPPFLEVLRTIGKEPLATNVADISRFSEQQRIDMAGAVAMDLLRSTGIPVDQNHPIIRELDEILDRKTLIDFGARLYQRRFRR